MKHRLHTVFGPIEVTLTTRGVAAIEWAPGPEPGPEPATGYKALPGVPAGETCRILKSVERRLAGAAVPVPIDWGSLTPFAQRVLRQTMEIPRGEVRSYGWVASRLGQPGAVRAVGTALRRNPLPLLVPCHRVVPINGQLGAYTGDSGWSGGTALKAELLRREGLDFKRVAEYARLR